MWFTKDLLPRRGARGRASGRVLAGVVIVASFAVTAALPLPAIAADTVSSAADAASASGATQAAAPDVIAPSAVVIDQVTGTVLYEKDADSARSFGRTARIMTALLAIEHGGLDDKVTIEQSDLDAAGGNAAAELAAGDQMTASSLLVCLLTANDDVAAYALARHVSGDVESFVTAMNARAKKLGCKDTVFANPTGSDADGAHTTARDLAIVLVEALAHDEFKAASASVETSVTDAEGARAHTLASANILLDQNSSAYAKGEVEGGVTGLSSTGGRTVAVGAARDGLSVAMVMLGAADIQDAAAVKVIFTDARNMLDWALSNWQMTSVATKGNQLTTAPIRLSLDGDSVGLVARGNLCACVPAGTDLKSLTYTLSWDDTLAAPIKRGDALGDVVVKLGDEVLGSVKVVAASSMGRSWQLELLDFALNPLNDLIVVIALALIAVLAGGMFKGDRPRRRGYTGVGTRRGPLGRMRRRSGFLARGRKNRYLMGGRGSSMGYLRSSGDRPYGLPGRTGRRAASRAGHRRAHPAYRARGRLSGFFWGSAKARRRK